LASPRLLPLLMLKLGFLTGYHTDQWRFINWLGVLALASGDPALDYVGTGGDAAPGPWRGQTYDPKVLDEYKQYFPAQEHLQMQPTEIVKALKERPVLLAQARDRLHDVISQFETHTDASGKPISWPRDATQNVRESHHMKRLLRTVVGDLQRVSRQRQPQAGQLHAVRSRYFVRQKDKLHRASDGINVLGGGGLHADFNWHWTGASRRVASGSSTPTGSVGRVVNASTAPRPTDASAVPYSALDDKKST